MTPVEGERGIANTAMEVGTSLVLAGLAAVAIWDSRRIGAGWTEEGPQSGYFPFWIAFILLAASVGTMWQALRTKEGGLFLTWTQARMVWSVLLPLTVYVVAAQVIGIYVASALLVGYCMVALGGFRWSTAALSGLATALVVYVTFEIWFLVALPKGPLEEMLGL